MHYSLMDSEGLLKITYMTLSDAIQDCTFKVLTPNSSLTTVDIQGEYLNRIYDTVCGPSAVSEKTHTGLITSRLEGNAPSKGQAPSTRQD